jgi:hypothetical protein
MLNEQLIQSLTAYTSTLEQQIAALEARVAQLEAQLEKCELASKIDELEQQLAEQAALIAALAAQPAVQTVAQAEEPEIEIELVMEDDDDEAPAELEQVEDHTEEPEQQEQQEEPELVVAPEIEAVVEARGEEVRGERREAEAEVEVTPAPKAEARMAPQQTSLFGPAVTDIREAISLGDRFLFQRELFAGNGELMQKTLDQINMLSTLSEAMEFIRDNFEWDMESTAVQLFENVLRRRFS